MQINITSTIYLTAAFQAVLLIFVILRKNRMHYSERYLIATLAFLIITLVHYVSIINGLMRRSILMDVSAISWYTISPLLYLYSRALVHPRESWKWTYLLYFPCSIYLLLQIFLISAGSRVGFFLLFKDGNTYTICWIMMYLINSLLFTMASIWVLKKADIPAKHRQRIRWLVLFFSGLAVILLGLIAVLLYWLNVRYFVASFEYILLVFYALFIFSLVALSLRFSNYFSLLSNDHYGHDQKKNEELKALFLRLEEHLEKDKPYLRPKLSLSDLSQATDIPENQLSQIFTRYLRTNFYQFVNTYRLKEFETQLRQKGTQRYTIMALAELAGFSSKATFYKVFREHYQMTPSEFIKRTK